MIKHAECRALYDLLIILSDIYSITVFADCVYSDSIYLIQYLCKTKNIYIIIRDM